MPDFVEGTKFVLAARLHINQTFVRERHAAGAHNSEGRDIAQLRPRFNHIPSSKLNPAAITAGASSLI